MTTSNSNGQYYPSIFSQKEWTDICSSLKLTDRQVQIAALLLDGRKTLNVAMTLGISHATVRAHLRRIYPKLGVSDRLELMARCVREFRELYPLQTDSVDG